MEPETGRTETEPRAGEPASGLDDHASAALERLTRWAGKSLRAAAAVVTLADGEEQVAAGATGAAHACENARLREFAARIVRSGRPHVIDDARDERWRTDGGVDGVAFLGAPLVGRGGAPIGSFCVMDGRRRRWTIQEIELVGELASSAATELDLCTARAAAEREQRWSERQQAVLELIAARAPLARTLTDLLRAAETQAPGMLAAIARLEHVRGEADRLRAIAGHGLPRSFISALDGVAAGEGSSISGTAAFRREPVVIGDIAEAGLHPWFAGLAASHGLRAGWSTPILSRGTVFGTLTVYYRTARTPGARDRLVVERSVHLARLAIEQVHGAQALRRSATRAQSLVREQTALQRVATQVAGDTDPRAVFALVAEEVGRLLKADAGYVLRFEEDARYRAVGAWARDEQRVLALDAVAKHLPDGICALLRTGRTARRSTVEPGRDALRFRHRIAAPVLVDGSSWGIVVALHDSSEFPREDEKRLMSFAQLVGVAVANALAHEALAIQARTDPLTGIANRRTFDERLAEEAERASRHARALSLVLVDVDNFKAINDRFGHATGDRVLVALAGSLRAGMRSGDLLARIGGDELALLLPDCTPEQAALVAQRLLDVVRADSSLARRHGVTLSAGVAGLAAGQAADDLLRCADQALYAAKDGGRNRVVGHDAGMSDRAGLRLGA